MDDSKYSDVKSIVTISSDCFIGWTPQLVGTACIIYNIYLQCRFQLAQESTLLYEQVGGDNDDWIGLLFSLYLCVFCEERKDDRDTVVIKYPFL